MCHKEAEVALREEAQAAAQAGVGTEAVAAAEAGASPQYSVETVD